MLRPILTGAVAAGIWHLINRLLVPIRESDWTIEDVNPEEIPQEYLILNNKRDKFILDRDKIRKAAGYKATNKIPGLRVYRKLRYKVVAFLVLTTIFTFLITALATYIVIIS